MKTIYKYPLGDNLTDDFTIDLPWGAQVLTVQTQHGVPNIWALVETDNTPEPRTFRLAGTGHDLGLQHDWRYVGTFQLHGGGLVFHLFEELQEVPF